MQRAPLALTRFFGRASEGAELAGLLGRSRLVTLVGAPGCGKSRLSLELAARVADRHPAGVWFVELASIADPLLTARTVATALGVRDLPRRSVEETLVNALATEERLVVLDNCEHVAEAVAPLVARLLDRCPPLRMLITSRKALGLQGEQVWPVPPLDLGPAVELFMDRAELASGLGADAPAIGVVERICERLDGLPLAIELAAAWTRVLTPAEIFDRLDRALPLLRTHARDTSPRQRTMEATVDWSYQLLEPAEQLVFERLSVFAGGFDLEAARAVAPGQDVPSGLATLVDHSLVVAEPVSTEMMRYRLLEPVRQCAEARLTLRGHGDAARRHHGEHYLDVALRSDAELHNGQAHAVLSRLEAEEGNLRLALDWSRFQPDDLGLRLCTALANAWALRGRVNEGRAWMDEMLETKTADRRLRASALARASRLAWRQLDYASTRTLLEESLTIDRELGDPRRVARRLRSLAMVAMAQGDLDEAEQLCEQSISIFRDQGDQYGLGLALAFLGLTLHLAGQNERGDSCAQEALALSRATGNLMGAIYGLAGVSFGAIATGDMADLRALGPETAYLLRTLGGMLEDPGWLWTTVAFASGEGRYRAALRLAGAVEERARQDGVHFHEQFRRYMLPWLERAQARVGAAEAARLAVEGSKMTLEELIEEGLREPDANGDAPLSVREREVADLIAQGLANTEIAQLLVISKRTVESHVVHIKAKLGFARRAQIVGWALDRKNDDSTS